MITSEEIGMNCSDRGNVSLGTFDSTGPPHTDRLPQPRLQPHNTRRTKERIPEKPEPKTLLSDITETWAVPQNHHRRSHPLPTWAQTGSTILQHHNHHHQCQRWVGREAAETKEDGQKGEDRWRTTKGKRQKQQINVISHQETSVGWVLKASACKLNLPVTRLC